MKKFITENIIFFLILGLPLILITVVLKDFIPAPRISNSYSLNEKLKFVATNDIKNPEIISIGSSIAFNNLSSDDITEAFDSESYLNLSSWGLRMSDSYLILKESLDVLKPRKVIIASSAIDFNGPTIQYNVQTLNNYLSSSNLLYYQYKTFNPKYFFKRLITNRLYFTTDKIYRSLKFDEHGAVLLSDSGLEFSKQRWEHEVVFEYINHNSYLILDSISNLLAKNNIELIFVQSPIRQDIRTRIYKDEIVPHMQKVDSILSQYNHIFIDCTEQNLSDDYFADSQHLNSSGAKEFTRYWIDTYFNVHASDSLVSYMQNN
jgi:hypothetical protein